MKKLFIFCIMFPLLLSAVNAQDNRIQTEQENMQIITIDPVPMVAPTENIDAMNAYNSGTLYMRDGMLEEAEDYLSLAIELDPFFVDAMDHLGIVYRRQNRLEEAEAMYLRSIEINSQNKVPYQNLAVVYRLQNRLNEAFELYRMLIILDENDPEGYYGIAELFFIVGQNENAMPFIDRAIQLYYAAGSPLLLNAFYYKGMLLYRMENFDEALLFLQAAREAHPNNATLNNALNDILSRQ